jgi:DNA-directed RNA polymerase subunit RPC12/RpoP
LQFTRRTDRLRLEKRGGGLLSSGQDVAGTSQSAGVVCKRCATPIVVASPEKVAEEFSVACPKCGHRTLYRIREIKTIEKR